MTRSLIGGGHKIPCFIHLQYIHKCNIRANRWSRTVILMTPRRHAHARHFSFDTIRTVKQLRVLMHVHIPETYFSTIHLTGRRSVWANLACQTSRKLTSIFGLARPCCSPTFLKLTSNIPSVRQLNPIILIRTLTKQIFLVNWTVYSSWHRPVTETRLFAIFGKCWQQSSVTGPVPLDSWNSDVPCLFDFTTLSKAVPV